MTQEELAKAVGFASRSSISRIESGEFSTTLSQTMKIAQVLGIDSETLYSMATEDNWPEYLPYLQNADRETITVIRRLLGMPSLDQN